MIIISIDGTAGSGKSTTARLVAQKLGFLYIDTGAMYRAATLIVLTSDVDPHDKNSVTKLVHDSDISLVNNKGELKVLVNKIDVTKDIRSPKVTGFVSLISSYRRVREYLVGLQRAMAENNNVVCEGRDIGTVVFPNADIKIYIDCSLEERAKRRLLDLKRAQVNTNLEKVKQELERRDKMDSKREFSPLRIPECAEIIDTTNLKIEEQVERVLDLIHSLEGV
ncbi:MAG: (d)CMP kinase [Candidatus Cloacimonadota bacterium]|nr:MAG: (d)CMP kinase [Candidatus Cloacimonadota bacterium]